MPKDSFIINASEIGQFFFCSISWYLQKYGNKPISKFLEKGKLKHLEYGNMVKNKNLYAKRSRILANIGYILLIFAILTILNEVIL